MGEAGLRKLRGMYAFALWDEFQQELWLARDPYGHQTALRVGKSGTLWFASQARALANCAPVDTKREAAALVGFYLWGHVPEPFSWWAGIRMFPAGHVQRFSAGRERSPPKPFACVEESYLYKPAEPVSARRTAKIAAGFGARPYGVRRSGWRIPFGGYRLQRDRRAGG